VSKVFDLTEGSIIKKLFLLALPVLLTTISQMAYNLTDMFWIGRVDNIGLVEKEAISAIGTAGYVTWFAFGLILIAKIGTSVKVSHAVGEKQWGDLNRYASNGLLLQLLLGSVFSVLIFIFKRPILSIFDISSPQVVIYAMQYLSIVGGLLVFQFVSNGFAAINEGLGKTKTNFRIMVVGLIVNMILDPILILVFRLGVQGAAIATVIAQGLTLGVFFLHHHWQKEKLYRFHVSEFDPKAMQDILRIGLPAGIQSMVFTSISIYIARMVFRFGDDVMAAQRVGTQIEQLTWMISGGFQAALTVFVGQNFGAKAFGRIRKGFGIISFVLLPYAFIVGLMLFFFGEELMGLFLDDPVTKAFGMRYLRIISLAQVFMMAEAIGAGVFNGIGRTYVPSIIGVIGNGIRIPLAMFLILSFQEEGIWWALNYSDIFKGIILFAGAVIVLINIEKIRRKQSKKLIVPAEGV
jgi:putative MATE family efflux protein